MNRLIMILLFLSTASLVLAGDVYQSQDDFLAEVFPDGLPAARVIWLKDRVRDDTTAIMGHRYPGVRVRYWRQDTRSAWILEEIGKEKPITVGLVVNDARLELVRVLAFRESRGWEVRYPFFTDQFRGAGLEEGFALDRDIDGISGATLSVRALEKLARLAIYLHARTGDDTP